MHAYRSHTCGELRQADVGQTVKLSGWLHRRRDHGGVMFIDLRDHYGLTQCVFDPDFPAFAVVERLRTGGLLILGAGEDVCWLNDSVQRLQWPGVCAYIKIGG